MTTEHSEQLKNAALKAGMIDIDALALADGKHDGTVKGADELVAALKVAKPFLFRKHARDMSEAERAEAWATFKRKPPPAPMDTSKLAKDMSQAERDAFLKECARRFG